MERALKEINDGREENFCIMLIGVMMTLCSAGLKTDDDSGKKRSEGENDERCV